MNSTGTQRLLNSTLIDNTSKNEVVHVSSSSSSSPKQLETYYNRLFPVSLMHTWLCYGNTEVSTHREICFTLADGTYCRYLSFENKETFKKMLVERCPSKMDIGALFTAPVSRHAELPAFEAVSKEFVLDIDLTDYDDIRSCCKGGEVCVSCWRWMVVAIRILNKVLRETFGCQHVLWVYSGRRGVHGWVCDPRVRRWNNSVRSHVVEYLTYTPTSFSSDQLRDVYQLITSVFDDPGDAPDEEHMHSVVKYAYPRLDSNVSKKMNHLLKAPFCVHPATQQVCIPIDPSKCDTFNPANVPTLTSLLHELSGNGKEEEEEEEEEERKTANDTTTSTATAKNWKHTSIAPHIEYFKQFVNTLPKNTQ